MLHDGTWLREDGVHLHRHGHETDAEYVWVATSEVRGRVEIEAPNVFVAIDEVDLVWPD
jgi:hypothetical protein